MPLTDEQRAMQKEALVDIVYDLCEVEKPPARLLVVGCGDGSEASAFSSHAEEVVGIDPEVPESGDIRSTLPDNVTLARGFAEQLPFPDDSFDFILYFHVIEHVQDAQRSLVEIARVLSPGGKVFVGTPNAWRLVGYIGGDATKMEIIRWNLQDWWMRLTLRWSNAKGAHAGFSRRRLRAMLEPLFSEVQDCTVDYARQRSSRMMFVVMTAFGLWRIFLPSIYFCAVK